MCDFQIYDVLVVFEIHRPFLGAVVGVGPCLQVEYSRRWYVVEAADMSLQIVDGYHKTRNVSRILTCCHAEACASRHGSVPDASQLNKHWGEPQCNCAMLPSRQVCLTQDKLQEKHMVPEEEL